jgi:hypothetical protein
MTGGLILVALVGCSENKSQACVDKYGLKECIRRACSAYVDPYDQARCESGNSNRIGEQRKIRDWWK